MSMILLADLGHNDTIVLTTAIVTFGIVAVLAFIAWFFYS